MFTSISEEVNQLNHLVNPKGLLEAFKDLNHQLRTARNSQEKFTTFIQFVQGLDKINNINVSYVNINGFKNKKAEFVNFVLHNRLDIVAVAETHYRDRDSIRLRCYNHIRKDKPINHKQVRAKAGGGLIMFIKHGISYTEVTFQDITFEYIAIKLGSGLVLMAIYKNANIRISEKELDLIFGKHNKIIIMGDFNCRHTHWGNSSNNYNGSVLNNYVEGRSDVRFYPDGPTHFPFNGSTPSVLDIALNKNVDNMSEISILNELSSDHSPIYFQLKYKINKSEKFIWDYRNAD
nr:unnamed protein product [Callosobruchus chinensis]